MIRAFFESINPYKKLWQMLLAIVIISLVVMVLFWNEWIHSFKSFCITFSWAFAISSTQWIGHVFINNKISELYSWKDQTAKRAVFGSLAIIIYAVFAYLIVQIIMQRLVYGQLPENPVQWAIKSSIYAIVVSFGVSLIFTAVGFFRRWKESLLEAESFKNQMLAYKYESLQNQINPHFLFNSFNVLSDLVYEDQKKAVKFINQMSQLFRYVLDSRDKELVSISEEIEFIESFAYLLQTRFEDKLTIAIDIKAEKNELIVPMTMQLLIENCVKHNEISSLKPLNISISRKDNIIEVVNNLQLKHVGNDSKNTGLSNISQQYSFFTDQEISIEKTDSYFAVQIPILKADM